MAEHLEDVIKTFIKSAQAIGDGKIIFNTALELSCTYHNPCHLLGTFGIYEDKQCFFSKHLFLPLNSRFELDSTPYEKGYNTYGGLS